MRIVEATEDGEELKIKAEESKEKLDEATGKKVYVIQISWKWEDHIIAITSSKQLADKIEKEAVKHFGPEYDVIVYDALPLDIIWNDKDWINYYQD